MKNRLLYLYIIFLSFLSYSSDAQEVSDKDSSSKNYIISNISYSFIGARTFNSSSSLLPYVSGSSIRIVYHHMFFNNLGANISYSKTTGLSKFNHLQDYTTGNANIISDDNVAFNTSLHHSANIGLTYRNTAGKRHELLTAVGLSYKYLRYNSIGDMHHNYVDNVVTIKNYDYYSSKEVEFYLSLDYLFFVTKGFAIGIHGAYEQSHLPIANIGISLGYRF